VQEAAQVLVITGGFALVRRVCQRCHQLDELLQVKEE
jgi:hypothetical protein